MSGNVGPTESESTTRQVDTIIKSYGDWRGSTMSQLRDIFRNTDAEIVEEVKWRKPSNPMGVPVWSHNGIICIGNFLKNSVRLTFPQGFQISDPGKMFNSRLDSKTVRAIDFEKEGIVDMAGLKAILLEAVEINRVKSTMKIK
ncbi:MAG: DUF1801 domain-containing protein [Thermoplasmataceae archaeon]